MSKLITYFMEQGWLISDMLEVFKQFRWDSQSRSLLCVCLAQRLLGNLKPFCGTEQMATAADADSTQPPWDSATRQPRPVLQQILG